MNYVCFVTTYEYSLITFTAMVLQFWKKNTKTFETFYVLIFLTPLIVKVSSSLHKLSADELKDNDLIYDILSDSKPDLGVTHDFLFYIALVGLFPPSRNILKNWSTNQEVFIKLVKDEGMVGRDHFMQSLCLYFIKKYNSEMGKFAPTFMKKLVDENIMSDKFLIQWYDKEAKLDKDSGLYDKKSERKFRELIEQFI